ncbi:MULTISPECIES: SURF1 family cytochrome oxidase biogenesis protein [Streptomyces]|uniref:SURF1-like protein n=1 Tax=Streptomyces fradiae ATCC 10745 = DSM 40063 TaxID=1319510 RepID=A0A1Y2NZA6_STRFR|nr:MULTISPECIES: SURF1 family protein [Streptomyces]KAF0648022.1 membrane protein [Streptomyces fradiae ATCC 10745 = DSM 40063]OSY52846.1 SURF1 family protein [Streptomyces fradiae ATCC 10745 = DSM 40063]QEV11559.1 SURF1 family protein [Streptomyces fradiae ATCC 10745 = DSM 40063]
MYRFLLSRQWVILTLLALVLIPVMVELGFWQFHRHERRVAQNELIAANLAAKPVPVAELTSPGHTVPRSDYWRRATATGTFDTADEVVVRRRTNADDRVGMHVLTPLVLDDGRVVLVNRGWIPAAPDQKAYPDVPAAPKGRVTVTGRLMADQTTGSSGIKDLQGLPPRQVMLINSEQQAERTGREVLGGYLEMTEPAPAGDTPEPIPDPDHDSIGAHMAYAVQWWLFAAGVPVGWVVLVRRERHDRAAQAASGSTSADGSPHDGPSDTAPPDTAPPGGGASGGEAGGGATGGAQTTREPADA